MAIRPRRATAWLVVGTFLVANLWVAVPYVAAGTVSHDDVVAAEARAADAAARVEVARSELEAASLRMAALQDRVDDLAARAAAIAGLSTDAAQSARERIARLYALRLVDPSSIGVTIDLYGRIIRQAYFEAVTGHDRDALNTLTITGRDLGVLRTDLEEAVERQREDVAALQSELEGVSADAQQARQEATALRARWEEEEAARRAAREAELRRREQLLAAQQTTTTTSPPSGTSPTGTTTTTVPTTTTTSTTQPSDHGYQPGAGVEQWRPLLSEVFGRWGLDQERCGPDGCLGPQIDNALIIMRCESNGVPFAVNPSSGTTGLFQHRLEYWSARVARVRSHSQFSDFPSDATPFDPEHNIVVAGLLIWESRETLIGNLSWGGPWDDGPQPFGHWDGSSRYCADPPLVSP